MVGQVVQLPTGEFGKGQRVGIAWLRRTCGPGRYCTCRAENLRPTVWVHPLRCRWRVPRIRHGTRHLRLPAAQRLSLRRTRPVAVCRHHRMASPGPAQVLYGFGASTYLTAQIALVKAGPST
ncbi:MAG TPA: hypothetical protein VN748_19290 [Pseudonocardiaceae bacterium]|nr:hypothetical protein [Pseudonocardiaceae bacterium]